MDINLLTNQFTVFSALALNENIVHIASLFDEQYNRESIYNPAGASIYIFTKIDNSFRIEFAENRIDCFYSNDATDESNLKDFLVLINKISKSIPLRITRIAINYAWWIFDEEAKYLNTFNKHLNLNLGDAEELTLTTNNRKELAGINFNIITTIQNNIVQNKLTFENKNGLAFYIDINNVPVKELDIPKIESLFFSILTVLNERVSFCKDLINA